MMQFVMQPFKKILQTLKSWSKNADSLEEQRFQEDLQHDRQMKDQRHQYLKRHYGPRK